MILVTGATGNAGGAVVRALVEAGEPVRALIRKPGESELPDAVEAVTGDLNRPSSLAPALAGIRAVFLLSGYEGIDELLRAIRDAGAERVTLLSSSAAPSGDMQNAVARYHILTEQAVKRSGIPWTFLQPNSFMTNTLQWAPQLRAGDVIRAPFEHVSVATIDPDDVGAVAATVLTSPDHHGRVYRLSGPEPLLPADRVRILANVLGRDIRFEGQPDVEARKEMAATMPAEYVDAFFSFFAEGKLDESEVLPTVAEVTGRPPGTFERWAIAHAGAFRRGR
jgi:uncharacterized protein YbjT (DUF2867 family)